MKSVFLASLLLLGLLPHALAMPHHHHHDPLPETQAAAPVTGPQVTNVSFVQEPYPGGPGSRVVVTYDLASTAGPCTVSLRVSDNGGTTFDIVPQTVSGAVGPGIQPGIGHQIVWNISEDLPGRFIPNALVMVTADDGEECESCLLWSDPATWGGAVPAVGQNVTIPAGWHVILDQDANVGGLTIAGTLEFAREDLNLEANWIMVHGGELQVGTPEQPFTHQATITLNDTNTANSIMGMGTRGIMVMDGGELSLHGTPPTTAWTRINDHLENTETAATLAEPVDWKAGHQIVLAPTDWYRTTPTAQLGVTERIALAADAVGNSLTLAAPPNHSRWGVLQYVTSTGLSLTQPAVNSIQEIDLPPEMEGTPLVIDQRAEIGNLTRNIVVQAPDDPTWQNDGFGVHIMIMRDSAAHLDGVEIRRGGQRFRLGRYAFHWHMLSYPTNLEVSNGMPSEELGDATGQYIRNSVVNESMNRGIVIHGTNGVLVENNIVYNVRGHGIFTEDAAERRNTFDGNLVLRVRNPAPGYALKIHETTDPGLGIEAGSSGFWISNPDNIVTNNVAADCQAFGFWLAFTFRAWGESGHFDINPQRIALGEFSHNTAHSNRQRGIMLDFSEQSESGSIGNAALPARYIPTISYNGEGTDADFSNRVTFELTDLNLWKNTHNGIWDRGVGARNRRIVSADNCEKFFSGAGQDGVIERCLVVGTSLNSAVPRPPDIAGSPALHSGFATYHSTFDIRDNLVINFPLIPGETSGAFAEDDFYFRPVEKGTVRNTGNVLLNSHPGYKSRARFGTYDPGNPYAIWFNYAPAKWDPHGISGPANNYIVYNKPFLTYGLEADLEPITPDTLGDVQDPVAGLALAAGGVSVPGPFYGFTAFTLHGPGPFGPTNDDYDDVMGLEVRRYDATTRAYVDNWIVGGAPLGQGWGLEHMKDFAAHHNGVYELDFSYNQYHPGWGFGAAYRYPTNFRMEVENMLTEEDTLLIGIEFSGAVAPQVRMAPGSSVEAGGDFTQFTMFQSLNSFEEVRQSEGNTYWQDTTNNRVWVKLRGGNWVSNGQTYAADSDQLIYQTTYLYLRNPATAWW